MDENEPTSREAVGDWIESALASHDRFDGARQATHEHRREHDCTAHPTTDGSLLGVLARATGAQRILEIGCALGYSTLWLAHGAGPHGHVEAVDNDPSHVELAQAQLRAAGYADRVTLTVSEADARLDELTSPFDLIFSDGDLPTPDRLETFAALVRSGGVLISANLFLGQHDPQLPELEDIARYRSRLLADERWLTSFAGTKAVSVRR